MALGTEASARVLKQLTAAEAEQVSREIARTQTVGSQVVDAVLDEYEQVAVAVASMAEGGVDYAREVLEAALGPQRAKAILDRIREQMVETGLSRLKRATPDVLSTVLAGEHPQTIALVLAHLEPRLSAGVVEAMTPEQSGDVLYRMARMDKISPEVLEMVEAALGARSDVSLSQELTASGGPATVARVLNHLGGAVEKSLLEAIADRGKDVAEQIRNLMFVFEDLLRLDGRAMQRLLREIDGKTLALSMKAASEELKAHIIGNMAERAAAALREEMELLGAVRVKDVEAAHAAVVRGARDLHEQGEISLENVSEDDLIP
jgi:flagellar motor switch protein FliG